MNRLHHLILAAALSLSMIGFTKLASADEGIGLDVKVGTMGVGAEISASLIPHTRLRGGINYLIWEFNSTIDQVDYTFEPQFNSISALFDIHPFGGAFFLSGGVYFNNNTHHQFTAVVSYLDYNNTRPLRIIYFFHSEAKS